MSDYTELVKALRHCTDNEPSNGDCWNCPYQGEKCHTLLSDAAAAIEDLQAEIKRIQAQLPKRGEIVRCKECRWGHLCVTGQHLGLDGFCSKGEMEVQDGQE